MNRRSRTFSGTRLVADGIGRHLRFSRRQRKYSLQKLEDMTGLTKSYLSKIERGVAVPSISTVLTLSKALGLSIGQLLGETTTDAAVCVDRRGKRPSFVRTGSRSGYNYEAIAAERRVKAMDAFIMRPPTSLERDVFFQHDGEELIFVLKGRMVVEFKDREVWLSVGDSIYFDAHLFHRSRSKGRATAQALVVVSKPQ